LYRFGERKISNKSPDFRARRFYNLAKKELISKLNNNMKKTFFSILLSIVFCKSIGFAQTTYTPTPENLKTREWFQDSKFGLFIHWGVYSVLADGEWVMNNQKIDKKTYEKLPAFFNPTAFDAKEWVSMAKAAGMKYITITSKHHDGFAMFDTKQTDWDIVDRTPYKKDVLKMLAEECQKQGIKLFFYHSHLDLAQQQLFSTGLYRLVVRPPK
jgi:alpha-L-fucosidase